MDGSLGSSTAKMFAPYANDAKNTGVYVTGADTMRSYIRSADALGLNVCVHAIGDQANAVLLTCSPMSRRRTARRIVGSELNTFNTSDRKTTSGSRN